MAIGIFANSLIGRWLSYPLIQAGGRVAIPVIIEDA